MKPFLGAYDLDGMAGPGLVCACVHHGEPAFRNLRALREPIVESTGRRGKLRAGEKLVGFGVGERV